MTTPPTSHTTAAPYDTDGAPATHYRTPDCTWRDARTGPDGKPETPGELTPEGSPIPDLDLTESRSAFRTALVSLNIKAADAARAADLFAAVVPQVLARLVPEELTKARTDLEQTRAKLTAAHDALTRINDADDDSMTTLESTVEHVVSGYRRLVAAEAEAADEITRLTAELEQTRGHLEEAKAAVRQTQADAEQIARTADKLRDQLADANQVVTAARAFLRAGPGQHRGHLAIALDAAIDALDAAPASVPPRCAQDAPVGAPADPSAPPPGWAYVGAVWQLLERIRALIAEDIPDPLGSIDEVATAAARVEAEQARLTPAGIGYASPTGSPTDPAGEEQQ